MRPIPRRWAPATTVVLLVVAACGSGSVPQVGPRAPNTPAEDLERAPAVEKPAAPDVDALVADVERNLAALETVRERRATLDRDLEQWSARARRLEEQIRAEREESEQLRARLAALEERLPDRARTEEADETATSSIADSWEIVPVEEDPSPPPRGGLLGLLWTALFGGDRDGEVDEDLDANVDDAVILAPAKE